MQHAREDLQLHLARGYNPETKTAERGREEQHGLLVKGLGSILPAGLGGSLAGFDVTWGSLQHSCDSAASMIKVPIRVPISFYPFTGTALQLSPSLRASQLQRCPAAERSPWSLLPESPEKSGAERYPETLCVVILIEIGIKTHRQHVAS